MVRRRITYANTMATLAVFIALGGSSYAALKVTGRNVKDESLTGADVKDASLRSKDVANRSLRAIDFRRGVVRRGRDGEPGADGFDGFDGADGAPGPGITLLSGRVNEIASQQSTVTFFGSPAAVGDASTDEASVQVLSPAEDTTASGLSVLFTRYPCDNNLSASACGVPGGATVTLRVDGVDTPVACTLTTPDTVCDSAETAQIPAGARLSLEVAGDLDGDDDDRDMLFGLSLRPAD